MHGRYSQVVIWEDVCMKYQTGMKLVVLPRTHMIHNMSVLAVVIFLGVNVPCMYVVILLIALRPV